MGEDRDFRGSSLAVGMSGDQEGSRQAWDEVAGRSEAGAV